MSLLRLLAGCAAATFAAALDAAPLTAPPPFVPPAVDAGPAPASADRDAELARLSALPASRVPLKGATLASAIRLLAGAARMSYLAPPDGDFGERITIDVSMSPYRLLEVLGRTYNFGFDYSEGVWRFYRINLNELVTKAYTLRFNNLERVTISSSSINSQLAAAGGGAGSAHSGLGAVGTFDSKPDKIIDDIRKILTLPTVGLDTPSLDGHPLPGADAARKPMDAPKIEPIWNPDTSQLFVVATRQQHSLVAAYLKTVDHPQKLVRIAVKFVETMRNPQKSVGVDWSKTFLGSGGPISLSGGSSTTKASLASNAGTTAVTATNDSNGSSSSSNTTSNSGGTSSSSTSSSNLLTLASPVNLNHPGSVPLPISLLSAPAFQWTLQAIASDQNSSIVQDPVIYTSNNREVSFKATTQQPIQQGTTTIGSATAATSVQIAYIDVGTELAVLPSILPGDGRSREIVQLNLSINVSSIVGTQIIGGNPYPVTSSRAYTYSVSVPAGQTLAIAGLEERSRQTNENKVPVFGDIPVLGYAFKNKSESLVHTTLIAFITPELVETGGGEAAPAAAADVPEFRHRVFEGSKAETLAQVDQTLDGLPGDIEALRACATAENRARVLNRIERIGVELQLIEVRLAEIRVEGGRDPEKEVARATQCRGQLDAARERVAALQG